MSVQVEAHFSDRLAGVLAGRLNMGTPTWVIEKTKGLKLASGESILFVSGLLSVSNREEKSQYFCQTPQTNFTWVPEPPRTPRPSSRRSMYDRDDYFGYKPRKVGSVGTESVSPKPGRPSEEFKTYTKNNGERWDHCLSQGLFTDTVKRPQLYPFHAKLNGESMHSFLVGSKYNKKNYTNPHHIQLFDYYPPSSHAETIDKKYKGLKRKSAKLRTVSSETEFTSKLKQPLPKDVTNPTFQPSRPTSARIGATDVSPKRPVTQQSRRPRVDQFRLRRLHSAPSHRQISHLQGFTKQVFDRLEMNRRSPKLDKGVSVGSRPMSAMSHKSGSSECVICNSPDLWKAYVEQQRYHSHNDRDLDELNIEKEEVTSVKFEKQDPKTDDEQRETTMQDRGNQVGEEKVSTMRIFATEPVLDSEDTQPPVMGVEIIVRERPENSEGGEIQDREGAKKSEANDDVIVINRNTDFPPGPEKLEELGLSSGTRHLSSPVQQEQ